MDVLCVGLAVCDILIKPVSEKTLETDTSTAETIAICGGGDAYNVATNIATLGVDVGLICGVGRDLMGEMITHSATEKNVNTDYIVYKDKSTSSSAVLIAPDGERCFVSYKGACHALVNDDVPDSALENTKILYVGSAFDLPSLDGEGMKKLFMRARERGITTALDVTTAPTHESMITLAPILPYVDLFMPSRREAMGLTGCNTPEEAAERLKIMGATTVVVKLGADGCYVTDKTTSFTAKAYPSEVIDTTGAGDAFVSGFLAAHQKGLSLKECARYGNAAGAICVRKIGASNTLSDFEQLNKIINNY